MAQWKDSLGKWAEGIEERWDNLRSELTRKLKLNDPVQIIPYRSYGTPRRIYIKGRVVEDKGIAGAGDRDTIWNNLLHPRVVLLTWRPLLHHFRSVCTY